MKKLFLIITTVLWISAPAFGQQATNENQIETIVWKMVDEGHYQNQNVAHLKKELARIKSEIAQAVKIAHHEETSALLELESEKNGILYRIEIAGLISKINPSLTGKERTDIFNAIADKITKCDDNELAKLSFLGELNPKYSGLFDDATLRSCALAYKEINRHKKLSENEAENYCRDKGIAASATSTEGNTQSPPEKPVAAIGDALVQKGPPDTVLIEDYTAGNPLTPK